MLMDEKNIVCLVCVYVCDSENVNLENCVNHVEEEDSENVIVLSLMQSISVNLFYYHFLVSSCIGPRL